MPSCPTRLLVASFIALAACGLAQAQVTYTLTNLGTLGGSDNAGSSVPYSYAAAINNAGQIVGSSYTPAHVQHAFLYQNGTMTDLATTYGAGFIQAEDINNSSQIVGGNSVLISGGVRSTTTAFYPNAINDSGFMAGADTAFPNHAATFSNGSVTVFGTTQSVANGVNSAGTVVGYAANASNQFRAYSYAGGTMTMLGTLGGNSSIAFDINDSNQIVGNAKNSAGFNHAFLYQNGVMTDLSTLDGLPNTQSSASAINASGRIVGYSNIGITAQHAFLYENGVMLDLNTLIGGSALSAAGFQSLTFALDINDNNQIVGYGRPIGGDSSTQQAFLITVSGSAIPEPAACAALSGLGILAFGAWFRRRR